MCKVLEIIGFIVVLAFILLILAVLAYKVAYYISLAKNANKNSAIATLAKSKTLEDNIQVIYELRKFNNKGSL